MRHMEQIHGTDTLKKTCKKHLCVGPANIPFFPSWPSSTSDWEPSPAPPAIGGARCPPPNARHMPRITPPVPPAPPASPHCWHTCPAGIAHADAPAVPPCRPHHPSPDSRCVPPTISHRPTVVLPTNSSKLVPSCLRFDRNKYPYQKAAGI
jgi:hypothetical protein